MSAGLILTLQNIINQSPTYTEIDIVIARYLLNHLYKENLSINDIATECHISKASVTRFSQNLGYAGFNDLKKDYHLTYIELDEMKIDLNAITNKQVSPLQKNILSEFQNSVNDLAAYAEKLDLKEFENLSELIHDASNVHLYATLIPGNMAEILQHMLLTAGKFVEYYPQLNNQLIAADNLKENDLAIFISLEGSYVMQKDLTLKITRSKATTVLLTHNPEMKLSTVFDHVIHLGDHGAERGGKYKLLMFIEFLAHCYFNKYV